MLRASGQGRSATIKAGEEGLKTFAISPLNFSELIDKHPSLAKALLKALCARIRSLEQTLSSVLLVTARGRVGIVILAYELHVEPILSGDERLQ